ncbi:MAG TPA: DUF2807 domain-containing protein, partial [Chloroflexota bacterium]|nr:DUF2807 domain-containing protein [Chloroflexota bacterium]
GLTIEAEDNLLPALTSDVRGGTLHLSSDRAIRPTRPVRYAVTARRIDQILLDGGGAVNATGIDVDRLRVGLQGGGTLTVAGTALAQDVSLNGAGRYDAAGLSTRETTLTLNGAGYALVNATDRLRATLNGVGVVEYLGSPTVDRSINGLGTVRRKG